MKNITNNKPKKMKKSQKPIRNILDNPEIKEMLEKTQLHTTTTSPVPTPSIPKIQPNIKELPPLTDEFIKEIFDKQLMPLIQKEIDEKDKIRRNNEDFKHLEVFVSEYLKSFIILGYNLKGEKFTLVHTPTIHDHDALIEHLRQTFMKVISNIDGN